MVNTMSGYELDSSCDVTDAVGAGGEVLAKATGADSAINSLSVVNQVSATDTIAVGDTYEMLLSGYIINNSGTSRTHSCRVVIGAAQFDLELPAQGSNATNRVTVDIFVRVAVISTSLVVCYIRARNGAAAAVATIQDNVLAQDRSIQRASATNQTGASKTVAVGLLSNNTDTTQTFTRMRAVIWK